MAFCEFKNGIGQRRKYATINIAIIGSDNKLSPMKRQAIIWSYADIWPFIVKFQWNLNQRSMGFIPHDAFENAVGRISLICLGFTELRSSPLGTSNLYATASQITGVMGTWGSSQ